MLVELLTASALGLVIASSVLYKMTKSPPFRASIACTCGQVQGYVDSPSATRMVCYCDDCQAYAHKVSKGATLPLDACGGTDLLLIFPADVTFGQGQELLRIGLLKATTKTLRIF
ncbi:hypothetical protein ACHHYP_14932, partial [Achlya hypogyna]